jgi:hypothetical protein
METGQMDSITHVGLDVHKTTISVAVADYHSLSALRPASVICIVVTGAAALLAEVNAGRDPC